MDYKFPQQLFPGFYNTGPPLSVFKHSAGKWGSYEGVAPADVNVKGGSGRLSSWTFTPWHQAKAETWLPAEPAPLPLLSPKADYPWPSTPPDPMDFPQHMQNFFQDHHQDAFCSMSRLLGGNFNFSPGTKKKSDKNCVNMWKVKDFMARLKYKKCEYSYLTSTVNAYGGLLSDVIHDIPPALLADLLHEELTEQRDRLQFSECTTGGALAYIPFTQSGTGCLLYPGNQVLDRLNFHRVALQDHGGPVCLDARSNKPFSFRLKGPVRQISSASLLGHCCVAVRSDHLCGVWRFSETDEPRLLQVVQTGEPATCISASPHVLGEVLVADESGAASLWTVGKGMQKFREEDSNLYFNARSPWRWCEFSAHPRVMLYADRTGVELTDLRTKPGFSHTLFRIGHTSECRSGERVILSRYLGHAHSFHHLITTQYSAYIMDERFPCMPMLKWDHMMQYPPLFGHVLTGPASSTSVVGGASTTKVLLGSGSSQEITMLQYSGGRAEACVSRGPPQVLLRPRDSLEHLPVQIPHRLDTAHSRLVLPAAGLTCIQKTRGGGEDCICVLQLTEAGDVFYQILKPQQPQIDSPRPPRQEEAPPPPHGADHNRPPPIVQQDSAALGRPSTTKDRKSQPALMETTTSGGETAQDKVVKLLPPDSQQLLSDSSSNEDVIGPTQRFVPETPERKQQLLDRTTSKQRNVLGGWESSSEDSELEGRRRDLKRWGVEVVVNDEPELDQTGLLDTEVKEKHVADNVADDSEEPAVPQHAEENVSSTSRSRIHPSPVKLSDGALVTWKHWLKKLMQKSRDNKPRPHRLQHYTIQTKHLLNLHGNRRRDPMEDRLQNLSRDLRECMTKSSLLVHGATNLPALEAVPVPNPVDTGAWLDELSQRLTVSWQGDEEWKSWWDERLGLNREKKMEALRRKRRRQKAARAGQRLELRGSFTSSVSYQSELGDLSEPTGWSSAASQGAWSDTDGFLSRLDVWSEPGTPRATTPSVMVTTPTDAPQQPQRQELLSPPSSHRAPSLSQTLWPDSTPAAILPQRKAKRPSEDYLSSLFASQESSEPQSYFLEEVNFMDADLLAIASSQLTGSQSVLQRSLGGAPEEPPLAQGDWSTKDFSQSLSLSQASQGRPRLSQSSQPKRKKSRMGF